jgi:hypothetical protein
LELSFENHRALALFVRVRAVGAQMAMALTDLELTPDEAHGLLARLMQCETLWGADDGSRD